ncbi:hypothetical protein B0O80DRAFT_504799 [Mortierella sp. GBAus27b]|nr:hypothetical protein B0O80DRAFT_504799 [Mortierella sp. GBAus27b]
MEEHDGRLDKYGKINGGLRESSYHCLPLTLASHQHRTLKAKLPSLSRGDSFSPARRGLWRQAHETLSKRAGGGNKLKLLSDASVTVSCTLNLEAPIVEEHFGHGFATKARNGFDLISRHQPTEDIRQTILLTLKNNNDLWKARAEISRLHVKYEEDDTLDQKQTLLNILDATDRAGECVSDASKAIKTVLNNEYVCAGTHGRRVNLLFYEGDDELCIFEFKSGRESRI